MRSHRCFAGLAILIAAAANCLAAAETVFSGPQVGERATPFKVVDVSGEVDRKEWDVVERIEGKPATIVFVHGVERSIVPLLAVIDEYGHEKRDVMKCAIVFLSGDRVESEKRLPMVAQSLRLKLPVALSVDGAEGPGNYGLSRQCLMTVLVTTENKVTANWALVQPGIADAPSILAAMAKACGDEKPPTAEALRARRTEGRDGMQPRGGPQTRPAAAGGRDLPGAAPTDEKLIGMLRSFINLKNDDARVDQVISNVKEYVKGNPDLTRQAIDGWTRVLHLQYGTEYARKSGQTMVDELKKP
jgi:hypothetical protein